MTVNNMFNVRFQMTNKQTDDELKAQFMCRFPKAMTRAYPGNQPYSNYTLSRLFQVETEDPRGVESFSLDLGHALGATTEAGVPVDQDWWDDYYAFDNEPSVDQVNALAAYTTLPRSRCQGAPGLGIVEGAARGLADNGRSAHNTVLVIRF